MTSLVERLLLEQRDLSAVERFAQRHTDEAVPLQARYYEDLLPVSGTPLPGQQLAFRVDLDACTGCKACVAACHSLNGLDPDETWRDVGLVLGGDGAASIQQTVTTACHHCEDPACLAGCPVRAYEKDPATGIVRHLDDQCIGCKYCVLKCPYDVPKYNTRLGIVRKCDMCAGRIAGGEAPACVQACPSSAISIESVPHFRPGEVPELLPGLGAAIPDSAYTRPTTRYVTSRPGAGLRPADEHELHPAEAHDPLAVMLVLMQLSVGVLFLDAALCTLAPGAHALQPLRLLVAAGAAALGLGSATLHLGRPRYAFRAFLGWRTSWMSREILAFGAYVPALAALAGSSALGAGAPLPLQGAALALGLAGTLCSIMIYADTRREHWALSRTAPTFLGTALLLGSAGAAAATAAGASWSRATPVGVAPLLALAAGAGVLKIAFERSLLRRARASGTSLSRSARLLDTTLSSRLGWRLRAATAAAGLGVLAALAPSALAAVGALGAVLAGELLERHLYFTAEASRGMPGQ